jgi:hypothetical protein
MAYTTFWNCHNGANQAWYLDRKSFVYPRQPLRDGQRFMIKSRMRGNKVLFFREHIGHNQYRLRIRTSNPSDYRQWFTFDRRTRTIRAYSWRGHAISNRYQYNFRRGAFVVVRPYRNEVYQRLSFYGGHRQNLRNNNRQCLDVWGGRNNEN